jgi:hypothetical protein
MQERGFPMARFFNGAVLLVCSVLALVATSAGASLYMLSVSGTVGSSNFAEIPAGTPWSFELIYETDAPDLDFELTGSPTPSFGLYTNTSSPHALTSFHYQAGAYEVTIEDTADHLALSNIQITFSTVNAIDINISGPDLFPMLGGETVSFHADFNDFSSRSIFVSDDLPTDPEFGVDSFDESAVSLLTSSGEVTGTALASFAVMPVPEPSALESEAAGVVALALIVARRRQRPSARRSPAPGR